MLIGLLIFESVDNGGAVEYIIFIPDGADSALVEVDYTFDVSGGEGTWMTFEIKLGTINHPLETVWEETINYSNPQ